MFTYGFRPDPYAAHVKMVSIVGNDKKVLDVGCSTGYLSKILKERNCEVMGIEIDQDAAEMAMKYCSNVLVHDVEELSPNDSLPKNFDVLLFGDILEHLKDPLSVLIKLRSRLKVNGYAVASIPNIAHIYARLKLLFGKWDYEMGGLLDKTHLRFFTIKSAIRLFLDAGYRVVSKDYTPWIPLFRLNKFLWGKHLEYLITRLFPTLFAFQIIIKAVPDRNLELPR